MTAVPIDPEPQHDRDDALADRLEARYALARWLCDYRETDTPLRRGRTWNTLPNLIKLAYLDDGGELFDHLARMGFTITRMEET